MQDIQIRNTFQQLLLVTHDLIPNKPVVGTDVTVNSLASLTKLVARKKELLRSLSVSHPLVVIVLAGTKIIYLDDRKVQFEAGELFIVPPHITFDVINQPASTGEYVALVLELSANLLDRVRQAYPEIVSSVKSHLTDDESQKNHLGVSFSSTLAEALVHLIKGTIHTTEAGDILNEHRLIEIVLLLLQSNARTILTQAMYPDFITYTRCLVRNDLASAWSLKRLAQTLDLSVSTLKRRFKEVGLSFRQLLDEERMSKAMHLLTQGQQTIAQIAIACGYESPSRFAARFRKYYSLNPSDVRLCRTGYTDPTKQV